MLKRVALSLTAAALALGVAMPITPVKADGLHLRSEGLYLQVFGMGQRWQDERRYWRKGDRLRAGRYNKAYHRHAMRVHYPYNCYWSGKTYTVSSRDYYGDWYRKIIWRPVHRCR